jgi:hypothetical protein
VAERSRRSATRGRRDPTSRRPQELQRNRRLGSMRTRQRDWRSPMGSCQKAWQTPNHRNRRDSHGRH